MQCYCCGQEIALARKVKLRELCDLKFPPGAFPSYGITQGHITPDEVDDDPRGSSWYRSYVENMTYRWTFICNACYRTVDNETGFAEIGGKKFNLAGKSRRDKATMVNQEQYLMFQKKEAEKMGFLI